MSAAPAPADATLPALPRGRLRLAAVALLQALWLFPWGQVQAPDGGTVDQTLAQRTGAAAAAALVALWGLSATTLLAGTRRGLARGAALTDAAVAATATALLLAAHAWIPGGEIREAWVPVFLPLGLLALLDAAAGVRGGAAREIPWLRAAAGLFAAGALAVDLAWVPAGIALWLGASPLLLATARTPAGARRALEGLLLAAATAAVLAPAVHAAVVAGGAVVRESVAVRYGWILAGTAVAASALAGLLAPPRRAAPA